MARLAFIGFIAAAAAAIFLFTQQQQALQIANLSGTAQAGAQTRLELAEVAQATAIAQAESASTAQAQSAAARGTAVALADSALTAQAQATAQLATAALEAESAATAQRRAEAGLKTATVAVATLAAQVDAAATAQAEATAELGTAVAQAEQAATAQANAENALATATAQLDLAAFSREVAEEDRAAALEQYGGVATAAWRLEATVTAIFVAANPPTPTPAPTVAGEPTAAPVPSSGGALTETFTTADGIISFNYPRGWVVEQNNRGQIFLANSADVTGELGPGDFIGTIIVTLGENITGLGAGASALDAADSISTSIASNAGAGTRLSPVTPVLIGGRDGARVEVNDTDNQAVILVMPLGNDVFVIGLGNALPGELNLHEATFSAIIATVRINPQ